MSSLINIVNQDCYEHIKTIPDNSVNLIITDPPYIIPNTKAGSKTKFKASVYDNWDKLDSKKDTITNGFDIDFMFKEFNRIQPFKNIYIFCNKNLLGELLAYSIANSITHYDVLIYHKLNPIPAYKYHYLNDLEYIYYLCDDKGTLQNTFETSSKLYQGNIGGGNKYTSHPTEKPIGIIEKFLRNSAKQGDLVYDPFSGSGSTAHACKSMGLNFIGSEIDKEYYEMSMKRLELVNGVLF